MRRVPFPFAKLDPRADLVQLIRALDQKFARLANVLDDFPDPFALTYGTTVTVNAVAAVYFTLTVTNGVAFTIANPLNPTPGQDLYLDILNSSGGAMGAITWGSEFLRDASFANPANTKRRVIGFTRVASLWVQRAPATGDM